MMKQKKQLIFILIILILLIISYFSFFNKDNSSIPVNTMSAFTGSIQKTISLSGIIASDYDQILVPSGIKVLKTYVSENDIVQSGDVLAELDSDELQIALQKSILSIEQFNADLTLAKNYKSGPQNDVLLNAISRGNEDYLRAKRDFVQSVSDLEKAYNLYTENIISQADYDKQVLLNKDLESYLAISELNYQDALTQYDNFIDNSQLKIDNLKRQIDALQLDINLLKDQIEDRKIVATVSGIVSDFPLVELRTTTPESRITIYDTSSYEFEAKAAQEEAVLIQEGQLAEIKVKGISSSFEGKVTQVGKIAEVDIQSGSRTPKVTIKIKITNPNNSLASGFDSDAIIQVAKLDQALLVKNEVIKTDIENKPFLFTLENSIAKKTWVSLGVSDGYYTEILSGLEENDVVIVNPPISVNDGSSVIENN